MGNESSQPLSFGQKIENNMEIRWQKLDGESGEARDGHCATSVGSKMFVFGGVCQNTAGESQETNQMLCLDTETNSWSVVSASGDEPSPRSSATMSAVGTKLYVFGGLSQDHGWFDDVHMFDTEKNMWSVVQAEGTAPSPRDKLASAVIGDSIYIFGGFGPQMSNEDDDDEEWEDEEEGSVPQDQQAAQFGWFDDLFIFNTINNKWTQPLQMNLGSPTPRAAHAMCAANKHLCIFGGRDSNARVNDLHIFNTETRKWEKPTVQGRAPSPRSFHSATTVGQRVVVLGGRGVSNQHFGDINIFDVETMQWLQPQLEGTLPASRGLHTSVVVKDKLIVFGGSSDFNPETMQCSTYFNDTHFINTGEITAAITTSGRDGDSVVGEGTASSSSTSVPGGSGDKDTYIDDGASPTKKRKVKTSDAEHKESVQKESAEKNDVVRGGAVQKENRENVSEGTTTTVPGKLAESPSKSPTKTLLGASNAENIS